MNDPVSVTKQVMELLEVSGKEQYFGEAVSKLDHALQCAHLAARAGADEEVILAALLHDIGHLFDDEATLRDERVGVVNHDETGARWLRELGFSDRVARLVGGHVNAKRYLTATSGSYMARLSPASLETLRLQGGPMRPEEIREFESQTALAELLRLRAWDEMAKNPEWAGPGLSAYSEMMLRHLSKSTP